MSSEESIKTRIAAAFAANELESQIVADVAFHMTDWKEDLDRLVSLYRDIERAPDSEIQEVIIRFLAHAPNHIAAARKLIGLGPIEDVFNVGVLEEDS